MRVLDILSGKSKATHIVNARGIINGNEMAFSLDNFSSLLHGLPWEEARTRGVVSRSSCWLVQHDCCCNYPYGNKLWKPSPWPVWVEKIARALEVLLKLPEYFFNSCNCNKYEGSKENLEFHSDNEPLFKKSEFDRDVFIASVSFGATRRFSIIKKYGKAIGPPIELKDGDIFTMEGRMQDDYQHAILPEKTFDPSIRFNLTFRAILRHQKGCPHRKTN